MYLKIISYVAIVLLLGSGILMPDLLSKKKMISDFEKKEALRLIDNRLQQYYYLNSGVLMENASLGEFKVEFLKTLGLENLGEDILPDIHYVKTDKDKYELKVTLSDGSDFVSEYSGRKLPEVDTER